jgi:hypothetical protein
MLKHEVMAEDKWHDNGSQDLSRYLCALSSAIDKVQFDKVQLCSLSVAYACPYHNPTATIGHAVHNVDISNPFAHGPRL